jgi:hypothetical protein
MNAWNPKTVGELRAILAALPDDMPLHHQGSMGEHPAGLCLLVRQLAEANAEAGYFADVSADPVWSKPQHANSFAKPFPALCTV